MTATIIDFATRCARPAPPPLALVEAPAPVQARAERRYFLGDIVLAGSVPDSPARGSIEAIRRLPDGGRVFSLRMIDGPAAGCIREEPEARILNKIWNLTI
jgi:hypothetical protein